MMSSIQTKASAGYPQIEPPALYQIAVGDRVVVQGMFVNNGPHSATVVAVVDYLHGQWAAYMAGVDGELSEDEAMIWCAAHGVKLPRVFGIKWFPELPAEHWRA